MERVRTGRRGDVRLRRSPDHPTAEPLAGAITAVHRYRLDTLTAEQAHQPPGTDMRRFGEQLRENYYPEMPDDAVVEVAELMTRPSL